MSVDTQEAYVVYVLTDHEHTDFTLQGYVGVTRLGRRKKRESEHRYACRTNRYGRTWTFERMITLFVGSLDECLRLERAMRPADGIGWNSDAGGAMFKRRLSSDRPGE